MNQIERQFSFASYISWWNIVARYGEKKLNKSKPWKLKSFSYTPKPHAPYIAACWNGMQMFLWPTYKNLQWNWPNQSQKIKFPQLLSPSSLKSWSQGVNVEPQFCIQANISRFPAGMAGAGAVAWWWCRRKTSLPKAPCRSCWKS